MTDLLLRAAPPNARNRRRSADVKPSNPRKPTLIAERRVRPAQLIAGDPFWIWSMRIIDAFAPRHSSGKTLNPNLWQRVSPSHEPLQRCSGRLRTGDATSPQGVGSAVLSRSKAALLSRFMGPMRFKMKRRLSMNSVGIAFHRVRFFASAVVDAVERGGTRPYPRGSWSKRRSKGSGAAREFTPPRIRR